MKAVTDYQKRLEKEYGDKYDTENEDRVGDYEYMFMAPEQYDAEDDILDFMDKNPDASFEELLAFVDTVIPTIEVVDEEVEGEEFDD